MHIKPYTDIAAVKVVSDQVRDVTMRIVAGPEHGAPNFIMRVFEIEPGGYSYLHKHDFEHEIFVHAGRGEMVYEDRTVPIGAGAIAYIKPNALHQIRNTGDERLTFVCVIPNRE